MDYSYRREPAEKSFEIERHLHQGENWIAVLVQSMNIPNYISAPVAAAVLIDIEGVASSGTDWEVCHSLEWREDVEIYTSQTGFCEYRNLQETPLGWEIGNDQAKWPAAEVLGKGADDFYGKKLLSRPIPELRTARYQPVEIASTAHIVSAPDIPDAKIALSIDKAKHSNIDGELSGRCTLLLTEGEHKIRIEPPENADGVSITFDFRREIIGFFELKLTAPDGTQVDLCHDEELFDGRAIACRCRYNFADRYITRNGTQVVGNTLHERGFRLVEVLIRNFREPLILHSVSAIDRRYPFQRRGTFNCSDTLLNRIWDVSVETLSTCTTDVFTDCPWRERAFRINDMVVENIVALQAFGDYRLNAHALRLAISNRRKDGWLPGMCPDKGELRNVLLPTNLFVTLILKDYYFYSGDSELLNELLPEMLELLKLFEALMDAEHQIVPPAEMWNFVLNQLREHGLFAQALSHIRAHWGKMIKTGTPTLWEIGVYPVYTEKRDAESAHSLCHGFCTTPVNYFQTAILGIRPISPGFGTFEAIPEAHDLEFAEGSIPTPKGNIRISVNKAACSRRS